MEKPTLRRVWLVVCCLLFVSQSVQCVIGGNVDTPCQIQTDCQSNESCLGGFCVKQGTKTEPATNDGGALPESSSPDLPQDRTATKPDVPTEPARPEPIAEGDEPMTDAGPLRDVDLPESSPDAGPMVPKELVGLIASGGAMSSPGYKLLGGVQATPTPTQTMSSPGYKLQIGVVSGTRP